MGGRVWLLLVMALAAGAADAELVGLRDGTVLSGVVSADTEQGIVFDSTWLGRLELGRDEIQTLRTGDTGRLGEDALRARGDSPDELLLVGGDRLLGRAEELPGGDVVFRTDRGDCRVAAAVIRVLVIRNDSWGPREIAPDELAGLMDDLRSADASTRMTAFNIVALSRDEGALAQVAELLAAPPGEMEIVVASADTGVASDGTASARLVARNAGEHGLWVAVDDEGTLVVRSTPRSHVLASLHPGEPDRELWRRRSTPPVAAPLDPPAGGAETFDEWAERASTPAAKRVRRNPSTMDNGLRNIRWVAPGGTVPAGRVGVSAKATQHGLEEEGIHRLQYDLVTRGPAKIDVTTSFPARHLVPALPVRPWHGAASWWWNLSGLPAEVLDRLSPDYVDAVTVRSLDTPESTELEVSLAIEYLPGAEDEDGASAEPEDDWRYPDLDDPTRRVWLCTHPGRNGMIPQAGPWPKKGREAPPPTWRLGACQLLVREEVSGALVDWRRFDVVPGEQIIWGGGHEVQIQRKPPRRLREPLPPGEPVLVGAGVPGRDVRAILGGPNRVGVLARLSLPRLPPGSYEILVVTDLGVLDLPREERATRWTPFVVTEARE